MSIVLNRWALWLLGNLLGMALFLRLAMPTWIEPELANEPGAGGGEFIVWGMSALPVFLLFMVAHFIFGMVAHRERESTGNWRGELIVGATLLCWLAVFLFDNAHHGA